MTPNRRTVSKDSLLSLDKFQKVKFSPSFSDDKTDVTSQDKSIKYQKQIRLEKLLLKAEYLIDTLKNMLEKTKRTSDVPTTVFEPNNSENV